MRFKKIEENSFPWHKLVCHPNLDEPNSRNFPNAVRDAIISNTGPTIQNSIPGIVNNLPDYAQLLIRQIKEATGLFQMRYIVEDESLERIIPPVKYLMIISDQIFPRLSANQMLSWKN